jgi:hypothetical protein
MTDLYCTSTSATTTAKNATSEKWALLNAQRYPAFWQMD